MSGTVDDLMLAEEALLLEAAIRRSFHRLAARLADGTDVAKFKTASLPLAPLSDAAAAAVAVVSSIDAISDVLRCTLLVPAGESIAAGPEGECVTVH